MHNNYSKAWNRRNEHQPGHINVQDFIISHLFRFFFFLFLQLKTWKGLLQHAAEWPGSCQKLQCVMWIGFKWIVVTSTWFLSPQQFIHVSVMCTYVRFFCCFLFFDLKLNQQESPVSVVLPIPMALFKHALLAIAYTGFSTAEYNWKRQFCCLHF